MQIVRAIAISIPLLFTTQAVAHDWYPAECCHEYDCAKITQELKVPGGYMITTKNGTTFFPEKFGIMPSRDGDDHACMRLNRENKMSPICLFRTPKA
jgi:hypothetical protein